MKMSGPQTSCEIIAGGVNSRWISNSLSEITTMRLSSKCEAAVNVSSSPQVCG